MSDPTLLDLVQEARDWRNSALPPSPWGDTHIAVRLADALEPLLTPEHPGNDGEWQYRSVMASGQVFSGLADVEAWYPRETIQRRRKAGPWAVVPGAERPREAESGWNTLTKSTMASGKITYTKTPTTPGAFDE